MGEEVVTQGESVAVPVKRVEGASPLSQIGHQWMHWSKFQVVKNS